MTLRHSPKLLKRNIVTIILLILLVPLYLILYKLYIPHVNAFGCFDDCFNYVGGYFIANGKIIYHNFFFNHQPIAAFISFLIQQITHPQNIFELVLRHRQFILVLGFLFSILLTLRFKLPAFFFIVIFEFSKFYVFGDRFLSEGMIVYPIIYLTGLVLSKNTNKKLHDFDYLMAAIFSWFIIFSREPYVPLAIFLTILIFLGKFNKIKYISSTLFIFLLIITFSLFKFDFQEYLFNVVTVNYKAILPADINTGMFGPKLLQAFLYPLYIPIYGEWNIFKNLLAGFDIVFLILFAYLLKERKFRLFGIIFIYLGLSNLRIVIPGSLFYAAFHFIIWYALFIFTTFFLIFYNFRNKILFWAGLLILFLSFSFFLSQKSYFGYEHVDQQVEFLTNYGEDLQDGSVINILTQPSDSVFIDGSSDLMYWQAKRMSNYKYTWYTSVMPLFSKYTHARLEMFKNNPPDFYREYGSCPKKSDPGPNYRLPSFVKNKYVRLYNLNQPSCLYVRKDIIVKITNQQWAKAKEFLYSKEPIKQ